MLFDRVNFEKTVIKLQKLGVVKNVEEFWSCKNCAKVYYGFDRAKKKNVKLYSLNEFSSDSVSSIDESVVQLYRKCVKNFH